MVPDDMHRPRSTDGARFETPIGAVVAPSLRNMNTDNNKVIYWHRDLPPLDAEPVADHVVEATSIRVKNSLAHRDELWDRCYDDLMAHVRDRVHQEVARLGGDYAHVLEESIDTRHDDATGEAWLHGRFSYVLLRGPVAPVHQPDVGIGSS